jgi:hypothetical protein
MLQPGPPLTTCSPPIPPTTRLSHPGDGSVPSYDTNKPTTVFPSFLDPVHLDRVAVAHSLLVRTAKEKKNPVPHPHHPPTTLHPPLAPSRGRPVPPPTAVPTPPVFVPFFQHSRSPFFYFFKKTLFVPFRIKTLN